LLARLCKFMIFGADRGIAPHRASSILKRAQGLLLWPALWGCGVCPYRWGGRQADQL
jgi:hypothetical protein